jgi:Tetratricopeptide repeat
MHDNTQSAKPPAPRSAGAWPRRSVRWNLWFCLGLAVLSVELFAVSLDLGPLQTLVTNGQPAEAADRLAAALEKDPDNARLLYNHGVAAYAAGRFDDALLSLDRAESLGRPELARKARFQKGNAEFRVGLAAKGANLDETISRWKESVHLYAETLKQEADPATQANFEFVRKQLLTLLLTDAKKNLQAGLQTNQFPANAIEKLRNAFEKFTDAKEVAPENSEAKEGEAASRDALAQALAKEGTRKTKTTQLVGPKAYEAPIPHPDYKQIEEGVAMIEDAHDLKPQDEAIKQALEDAKRRMADAFNQHARELMAQEERLPWPNEKLAVLRMAKEQAEKALDRVPDHQPAKETLAEVNKRLAGVMEERADELVQQSQQANLEQQAQSLSQSLDFYQQATELTPQEQRLPQKAKSTQEALEKVLDKLADKLMQDPKGKESLEAQAARLEGAEQALDELQTLKPTDQTAEKAQQVGEKLDGVRQKLSEQAQKAGEKPGGQQPGMAQGQPQFQGTPIDAPPRVNTPGQKGQFNSTAMNRKQDY